mmetsp:Transcript_28815/g.78067  ORF Transcript_28815/g.78067 Transcript_28815/m.78067 type:complete len:222 (-) Transcript_28815:1527-2192(-)
MEIGALDECPEPYVKTSVLVALVVKVGFTSLVGFTSRGTAVGLLVEALTPYIRSATVSSCTVLAVVSGGTRRGLGKIFFLSGITEPIFGLTSFLFCVFSLCTFARTSFGPSSFSNAGEDIGETKRGLSAEELFSFCTVARTSFGPTSLGRTRLGLTNLGPCDFAFTMFGLVSLGPLSFVFIKFGLTNFGPSEEEEGDAGTALTRRCSPSFVSSSSETSERE